MLPPRSRVARLTAAKGPPGKGGGGARVSGGIATHDQKERHYRLQYSTFNAHGTSKCVLSTIWAYFILLGLVAR